MANEFEIALKEPEKIYDSILIGYRRHMLPWKMISESRRSGFPYSPPTEDAFRKNRNIELGRMELLPPNLFSVLEASIYLDGLYKKYQPKFFAFYDSISQADWDPDTLDQFESRLCAIYVETPVHHLPTINGFHIFRIDHPEEKVASYVSLGYEDAQEFQSVSQTIEEWGFDILRESRISFSLFPLETSPLDLMTLKVIGPQLPAGSVEDFSRQIKPWVIDIQNVLRTTAAVKREQLEGNFTLQAPEL